MTIEPTVDIKNVICYRGGVYQGADVNQRIAELAEGLK